MEPNKEDRINTVVQQQLKERVDTEPEAEEKNNSERTTGISTQPTLPTTPHSTLEGRGGINWEEENGIQIEDSVEGTSEEENEDLSDMETETVDEEDNTDEITALSQFMLSLAVLCLTQRHGRNLCIKFQISSS